MRNRRAIPPHQPERRRTDRSQRWQFLAQVVLVTVVAVGFGVDRHEADGRTHRFEVELTKTCTAVNVGNAKFNAALDTLTANALASGSLTAAEKALRLKQYTDLHLVISTCPVVH